MGPKRSCRLDLTERIEVDDYCKLYLGTEWSLDAVDEFIQARIRAEGVADIEFGAMKNDDFGNPPLSEVYDFVTESTVCVEIESSGGDGNSVSFQTFVAHLVGRMREAGLVVVADCSFGEFIVEKTGWNWTNSSQRQPSS